MLWPAFSGRLLVISAFLVVGGACVAQTSATPSQTAKPGASGAASGQATHHSSSRSASSHNASSSSASHKSSAHSSSSHSASSAHHVAATASHARTKGKRGRKVASWRKRGQQKIDAQRAHDIQEALIREHYMDGTPSGVWDDASQKAMQKYQADHGWQSVMTPDSRALIKLGLGPDHAHLLNPESAMTTSGGGDSPQVSEPVSPPASPTPPDSSTPLPAQTSAGQQESPKK